MSRIAKNPVAIPKGVDVKFDGGFIVVKGSNGELKQKMHPAVTVKVDDSQNITFEMANDSREANAMSGTLRVLVSNMVQGVSKGFEKKLLIEGVGYRAQAQGDSLKLQLLFSHDVIYKLPKGVKAECPTQTEIILKGADKQQLGQVAAEIRSYRPPEPYKGKGIRYADEKVLLKEVKKK